SLRLLLPFPTRRSSDLWRARSIRSPASSPSDCSRSAPPTCCSWAPMRESGRSKGREMVGQLASWQDGRRTCESKLPWLAAESIRSEEHTSELQSRENLV